MLIATENQVSFLQGFIVFALFFFYFQFAMVGAFFEAIDTLVLVNGAVGLVFILLLGRHTHHSLLSLHLLQRTLYYSAGT